jgi:predicted dehydrogenase
MGGDTGDSSRYERQDSGGHRGRTGDPGRQRLGANAHVPAFRALADDYELRAVCTAHAETARASAEAFGAPLAFDDFQAMVGDPTIDLIAVVVRVPKHHDLVIDALRGGKAVFCEWPLGANLAEAEAMATLANERALPTAVGLQARSDPALMYARELVQQGYIGEVLSANLTAISQAVTRRGEGRIWQGQRSNGANTLTIAAGHAIDALCFILAEFAEVSAGLATTIPEWHNTDTGETVRVDSPDWVSVAGRLEPGAQVSVGGRLEPGAQVSFLVATVPHTPSGNRFEIYGTNGTLVISGGSLNLGPNHLHGARGGEALAAMEPPERFRLAPAAVPAGPPLNVAQAYVRLAAALKAGARFEPDFAHALRRHRLLEAIEQSAAEGRRRVEETGRAAQT